MLSRRSLTILASFAAVALSTVVVGQRLGPRFWSAERSPRPSGVRITPVSLGDDLSRLQFVDRAGERRLSPELMVPPGHELPVPALLHYLSFWSGAGQEFPEIANPVDDLLAALLEPRRETPYRLSRPPLFRGADRLWRGGLSSEGGEAHPDQLLSTLGALGINSDRRIPCPEGSVSIADAVESSFARFTLDGDIEWSLLTYVFYHLPNTRWQNRWGEQFSFDESACWLLERRTGTGACGGTHALFVLSALLRVQPRFSLLSATTETRCRRRLADASHRLVEAQHLDGYWNSTWAKDPTVHARDLDALQVTGHHLEWIALAPAELAPPRPRIEAAVAWCGQQLRQATAAEAQANICSFTHAARSLGLFSRLETN